MNCERCGGTGDVAVDPLFDVVNRKPCPSCVETFVCAVCGHTLPVAYRHEEKPEVCFLDYVSPADKAEIERIVAEVR